MSSNRLSQETSPYLLQHASNPVDWYPWGEEALERARREDRPIFLSIGYSACHWCHVMEHESFEDPGIARVMNEHYVNIKVDREERPDLDRIYMQAVQILTGHGGWPMSVWLTPQLEPYYGGTYFPPESRMGMPGFPDLMLRLAEAYRERRQDVAATAKELVEALEKTRRLPEKPTMLDSSLLDEAMHRMQRQFDPRNGGFGGRPKFPNPLKLSALLRLDSPIARSMVETTLRKMARGGLYDQLGGGFHRYSVDEKWLVPHFEKMLYDNALLSELYLEAWQATGEELFQRIAVETLDYVMAEMTDRQGGFYSTQDADSEGEEGKSFVWTPAELEHLLGAEDARVVGEALGVERGGNFEHGTSILHRPLDEDVVAARHDLKVHEVRERVEKARKILLEARKKRVAPGRDDKVLVAWNGLMAASFAKAGAA
ncbi:thioredoxin domain-containing protein, partial [bacterium CPR1]|nr:thioredoxin domain-containing protein [bacterium CPR1]